ncbi:MAG: NAD(P)-binding protein [Alphaproteobacteria bacterium]|nr:NAD(P)-binding protein [Alphaproteobacteria bacterium]
MRIGIIGTGISGLGAAYLLSPNHDITVYEKNSYIGGHSRTIDVPAGDNKTPVDTGFIVFNNWNYPHLLGLFKQLDVPYQKSDMSFGVSIDDSWLEYGSNGMFAQKKNLLRPQYYGMLTDIIRFNKQALSIVEDNNDMTLQQCLDKLNMGQWFRRYYLLAMGAAIWSCPIDTIMKFPARTFLQFFKNHGLLSITNRPKWYTVTGGSREYTKRLTTNLKDKIKLNCGATSVTHNDGKITITDANAEVQTYDRVVFACHADEAMTLIENPHAEIASTIGAFDYQDNEIVTHSDISFMPQNKKCWASWVYLSETREDKNEAVSLSYWMNNLQGQDANYPLIVTLNPGRRPDEDKIMDQHTFSHPIFDQKAINAQSKIPDIQGIDNMWFCGAYQRFGFHEDGLLSAVNVAKSMGESIPWE